MYPRTEQSLFPTTNESNKFERSCEQSEHETQLGEQEVESTRRSPFYFYLLPTPLLCLSFRISEAFHRVDCSNSTSRQMIKSSLSQRAWRPLPMIPVFKKMALRITESWIRKHVKLKHDNLDDVKSLSLPGTYNEKISSLGTSLSGFTRLKSLDLSRNALATTEGLESQQTLESLNLYYNNISSLKDLYGLRYLKNLKDLDLRLNPVAKNEPDYRLFIVHMLPNLHRLDDRSVRDSERRAAIMHFTSEQASEFENHLSPNLKIETERIPLPRSEMIRNLGPRTLALEDDDVAVIDFITRTGGDLTQPRGISGSSARAPDVENFTRDEIYKMYPSPAPLKQKSDTRNITQEKPKLLKDRMYVHFADDDDDFRLSSDPNLKYRDESTAYTTISTRGHFTPNPRTTDHHPSPIKLHSNSPALLNNDWRHLHDDQLADRDWKSDLTGLHSRGQDSSVPLSARSYELSPSKSQLSPRQSQGHLADKIGTGEGNNSRAIPSQDMPLTNPMTPIADESQPLDQGELLKKLLDLVDKYWNGSKSLQRHPKFQSLAKKLLSSYATTGGLGVPASSTHDDGKLDAELAERTAEISRLRDQMSEQQQELEQVRNKLRSQENTKDSLDVASRELVVAKARLKEVQEENVSLRSNMASLEAAKHGATEQERMIGDLQHKNISLQEQVTYLNQQVQQQNVNLQQLQELTNMLQESHRSLVSTNDHLLRELEETRQRHQHEVHQMHWSYDNLKKTIDWIPSSRK